MGFLQELVFQSHKQLIEIQQTGRRTQKNVKLDVSQTKPEVRQTVTDSGLNFIEILRKRLSFTWGGAEVHGLLSTVPVVQNITQVGLSGVLSMMMTNEWEMAFFWPLVSWHLDCDTLHIGECDCREGGYLRSALVQRTSGFTHVGKISKELDSVVKPNQRWERLDQTNERCGGPKVRQIKQEVR